MPISPPPTATIALRPATAADIPGILEIYNDAVANTTAIWNETLVDLENRLAWWTARTQAGFPVLVAVTTTGDVLGYASYGDWRPFDGYRHTVEHSVYVHPTARGLGLGQKLLLALIDAARAQGKHIMVAGIDAANEASIRLHHKLGFVSVGLMPQVGCKFGRWMDLAFLQLNLDQREIP